MLVRHIGLRVLSVVDEHINATAERHPLIVGRVDFPGWFQFIVGYVGDAHTIFLDPRFKRHLYRTWHRDSGARTYDG